MQWLPGELIEVGAVIKESLEGLETLSTLGKLYVEFQGRKEEAVLQEAVSQGSVVIHVHGRYLFTLLPRYVSSLVLKKSNSFTCYKRT